MNRSELSESELDTLIAEARRNWHTDGPDDPDGLWDTIEEEVFNHRAEESRAWWQAPSWRITALAAGLALIAGAGLGRLSIGGRPGGALNDPAALASSDIPSQPGTPESTPRQPGEQGRSAGELLDLSAASYFGNAATLLASLERASPSSAASNQFASDAANLLAITRRLLDSPANTDATLRALLDDLELVLAQIARLPAGDDASELAIIAEAIAGNDVVPRLQLAAAEYDDVEY